MNPASPSTPKRFCAAAARVSGLRLSMKPIWQNQQIQTKAMIASGPPRRAIQTSNFDFCIFGSFSTL